MIIFARFYRESSQVGIASWKSLSEDHHDHLPGTNISSLRLSAVPKTCWSSCSFILPNIWTIFFCHALRKKLLEVVAFSFSLRRPLFFQVHDIRRIRRRLSATSKRDLQLKKCTVSWRREKAYVAHVSIHLSIDFTSCLTALPFFSSLLSPLLFKHI